MTTLNLLLQRIKACITAISLFISLIYAQHWNEAPLDERAPLNDTRLLAQIETYPNYLIRDAEAKALLRHLWHFSEHLVVLPLFDPWVKITAKQAIVKKAELLTNARES